MSYVVNSELQGLAGVSTSTSSLDSLLTYVKSNREFVSKLIVKWLDLDRGVSFLPGYEKGVAKGGSKKTKIGSKIFDLSKAYDTLKQSGNRNKAQYDTMRAAALATILKRDLAHVAHSAAVVSATYKGFNWSGLVGLAGAAFSALSSNLLQSFLNFTAPLAPAQLKNLANSLLSVHSKLKDLPTKGLSGLGVYTKNNHSIDYYENPAYIQFSDNNIKNIYTTLRNADMDFQLLMKPISDFIVACLVPVNLLLLPTGKQFSAQDIKNILQLPLPTAGIAILLEPMSSNFRITADFWNKCNYLGRHVLVASGLYGVCATIAGIVAAAGGVPTAGISVATLGTTAGILGAAGAAGTAIGGILIAASQAKAPPSKNDFKTALVWGARLTFKPEPTASQIEKWYCDLLRSYGKSCGVAPNKVAPSNVTLPGSPVDVTAADQPQKVEKKDAEKSNHFLLAIAIGLGLGVFYLNTEGWLSAKTKE